MGAFIFYIIFFIVLPSYLGHSVSTARNRSGIKGLLVGCLFGWLGIGFMALTLKVRDPVTKFLK